MTFTQQEVNQQLQKQFEHLHKECIRLRATDERNFQKQLTDQYNHLSKTCSQLRQDDINSFQKQLKDLQKTKACETELKSQYNDLNDKCFHLIQKEKDQHNKDMEKFKKEFIQECDKKCNAFIKDQKLEKKGIGILKKKKSDSISKMSSIKVPVVENEHFSPTYWDTGVPRPEGIYPIEKDKQPVNFNNNILYTGNAPIEDPELEKSLRRATTKTNKISKSGVKDRLSVIQKFMERNSPVIKATDTKKRKNIKIDTTKNQEKIFKTFLPEVYFQPNYGKNPYPTQKNKKKRTTGGRKTRIAKIKTKRKKNIRSLHII